MANKIQIKRGLKADLPTLLIGELAYCTDTKELYIGTASGNILVNDSFFDITDNLTSTSKTAALSANQGRVLNEAINNITVGGTNLWLNSSVENSFHRWNIRDGVKTISKEVLWNGKPTIKFTKGNVESGGMNTIVRSGLPAKTQFMYSFMVYSNVASSIKEGILGHMQVVGTGDESNIHRETAMTYNPSILPANAWTKVSITFKTPAEIVTGETFTFRSYLWYLVNGATYYFADFQLEKGNIPTDWTPAPEDIQDQISNHQSAEMPHQFKVGTSDYKYGFRVDADGSLIFKYEEV